MTNITLLSDFSDRENKETTQVNPDDSAEIISLGELLQGPQERTRFIPIENKNPAFTQKINKYRERVQHGIWNLTDSSFSPTFDMIFKVCQTVLSTRFHPYFPRDDIIEGVNKLSLFECQYLLDGINEVIYPVSQTSLVPRMAYVHMIKNYIEKRIEELGNIEEMYFESNVKK